MRRARMTLCAIVALTVLTGCTAVFSPQSSNTTSPQSTPAEKPPTIERVTEDVARGPVEIQGLSGQRIIDSTHNAEARFAYLPGSDQFNQALAELVKQQLDINAEEQESTYFPQVHPADWQLQNRGCIPGTTFRPASEILANPDVSPTDGQRLSITCDVVIASGPVFAERLRVVKGDAQAVTLDTSETLFTHRDTGEVARGSALFSPEALPLTLQQVLDNMGPSVTFLPPQSGGPENPADFLAQTISDVHFDEDGNLIFAVTDAFTGALTNAASYPSEALFQIPAQIASDYLTPLGTAISEALASHTPPSPITATSPGQAYTNCSLTPCVALTFDDGPAARTPEVLEILASHDSAATFYLLGVNAANYPEIVKQIADSGNELGNHSWGHPDLTTLGPAGVVEEIQSTNQAIADASGITPATMRPPYGSFNQQTLDAAGMPAMRWSIDTNDWQKPGVGEIVNRAVNPAIPGDVILIHDIHDQSVDAVPGIVEGLRARGFTLVTVSQLFAGLLEPGSVYYGGSVDFG
ncbi:polysaccharide deacetylase family protein [Actinomycetaceae bacterium WB03_NA08]|uniref:Polysaccharide deacetylase family protein n=1 Tax=Scrofimicrobium canadense TaxID=2652290 RepID=A0A6N7VR92_9ACTO|nr:polysaccharide deacetylase family protein [Scrofimicrobium canadense]MSS84269.1 polysaccharide deacetylase family protein [Scrofimicrobium canadense]